MYKLFGAVVVAVAMLVGPSAMIPADARGGHGGHGHGSHGHMGSVHSNIGSVQSVRSVHSNIGNVPHVRQQAVIHHQHFRHHRRFIGVGVYGYGNCEWLRHRAVVTGSPYWWSRYDACLYGYGYDY